MLLSVNSGDFNLHGRHPVYGSNVATAPYDQDASGDIGCPSRATFKAIPIVDFQPDSGSYQQATSGYYACGKVQVDWTNKQATAESFDFMRFFDESGANSWRLTITCTDAADTAYDITAEYNFGGNWFGAGTVLGCVPNQTGTPGASEVYWEFHTDNVLTTSNSGYLRVPGFTEAAWSGLANAPSYQAEGQPMPHNADGGTGKFVGTPAFYTYSIVSWDTVARGPQTTNIATVTAGTVDALSRVMDVFSYYPDADGPENDYTKSDGHVSGSGKGFCLVDDPEDTEASGGTMWGNAAGDEQELVFNLPGVTPTTVDGVMVIVFLDSGNTQPPSIFVKADGEAYGEYTAAGDPDFPASGATGKFYTGDADRCAWIPLPRTPAGTTWTAALLTGMTVKLKGASSPVGVVQIDVLGTGLNRMTQNAPCTFALPIEPRPVRSAALRR